MSVGKHSAGTNPAAGGYQPTQQAQQQFQSGMPQPLPGVAEQLTQISGTAGPAVNTMVTQQMSPQQRFGQYSQAVFGGDPNSIYTPKFDQAAQQAKTDFFTGTLPQQQAQPVTLPGGQQLALNPQPQDPQSLINQINWETMRTMGLMKQT